MAKRKRQGPRRREHAAPLPNREAMSLLGGSIMGGGLTPDITSGALPDTGLTDTTEPTDAGGTSTASATDLAGVTQRIASEQAASAPGTASDGGVNAPQGEATSSSST